MSDVTVAPQGSAPSAAPNTPADGVPINPNPVSSPNPVGPQAPDKPVGDFKGSEHRAESRREAIKAAFERANNPQKQQPPKTAQPKPAEAKAGHNNPPEPTETLDLKKRPSEQPRAADQPRDRGRFAPREPQRDVRNQNAAQQRQALPETAPYRDPPPRMSQRAKADWTKTPETVRGDFHRLHQEADGIYRRYRGDHETMNSIRQYHEMATQHGTTLQRALSNYVSMEQKLRSDVIGGLDIIVNNLGLHYNGQPVGLRDIAYHVLSQSPEQLQAIQTQNAQGAQGHQIGALHQEIAALKQQQHQMHYAAQFSYTRSQVDQFAASHPRFDELGDLIENELKFGFDLETAYRRATLLRPGTRAAQTRPTSAQTRPTGKSIHGAPAPSNGAARRSDKPVGRREAIQSAINRVQGSL